MEQPSKDKRNSTIDIKTLLGSFKRLKIKSKRSKKQAPIVDSPAIETRLESSATATTITEYKEIIWTESLLDLPNELLEDVFLYLHPLDVVKWRQLCRRLKELIDNSIELQLRIDLAIDGYLLGHRGTDPAKDVIEFHQKRRKALESLQCFTSWEEPIAVGDMGNFEVCDGIFAQTLTGPANGSGFRTLIYKEVIPPQSRKKRWIRQWDDLGIVVTDFSFWAQGDLQMLMEPRDHDTSRRIHFRTMSTNEVHPKTALTHIDLHQADCPVWENCYTVAYEDRVAFAFWQGAPRTGAALVLDCTESKIIMPYMLVSDIAFLSRDEALLLFNGEGDHGISIAIYSFQLQQVVCECRFPFSGTSSLALFLTRPDSRFGDDCPSTIAKSLLPDAEVNILSMTIQLENHGRPAFCVLSVQLFRKMCNSLLDKIPDRKLFEWDEWGPTVTRWLPYQRIHPTGNRNIFGSRIIAWGPPVHLHEDSHEELCLILLDFNPRPIKRGAITCLEDYHEIVIDQETTWENPDDGTTIRSSLPYRAFTRHWLPRCTYFRFDGSTIIGKGWNAYHFYSFLPLESNEEREKEGSGVEIDVA
ncbi:hypothetical protein CPB86DRAFT_748272 [Serendipita vermifera]|nr:hypothetical protein CPB86DRAFT_748272 [Serendipita vermifera]